MPEFLFDMQGDEKKSESENAGMSSDDSKSERQPTGKLPSHWPAASDWTAHLESHLRSDPFQALMEFVQTERGQHNVFPAEENVFRAFALTSFADTRVVILGQDPYHGAGQAHGLSFSVPDGVPAPPSLKNIFKELYAGLDREAPNLKTVSGNLESWARQGVLLLNTVLTVRESSAGSHQKKGWEQFTDAVIGSLNDHPDPMVFVLWGKQAEKKTALIDKRHTLIISAHPSPLSASRGFFGSRPFTSANKALIASGRKPVMWI